MSIRTFSKSVLKVVPSKPERTNWKPHTKETCTSRELTHKCWETYQSVSHLHKHTQEWRIQLYRRYEERIKTISAFSRVENTLKKSGFNLNGLARSRMVRKWVKKWGKIGSFILTKLWELTYIVTTMITHPPKMTQYYIDREYREKTSGKMGNFILVKVWEFPHNSCKQQDVHYIYWDGCGLANLSEVENK